ncbi:TIGR03943 family protein [Streptacidiphilus sp. EB129]|uniref:TIGR03943 family putative permease subunit n=1 Tax=Streptacidiphilus sp. EB129 TaxID=3156262 RepID=UPI003519692F
MAAVRGLLRRHGSALLLTAVGAALLRISLFSELYLRYVKEGLRPLLVIAGVVLVLLGLSALLPHRRPRREHRPDPGHTHTHGGARPHRGPRSAWLLAVPALLLLLAAPPALGSFIVARDGSGTIARQVDFPRLPPHGTLSLSLSEFAARAVWDPAESLRSRTVRLTGFVTPGGAGSWRLSRIIVSCCAADARAVAVTVHGPAAPPDNTWVVVTGSWDPGSTAPTLDVTALRVVPAPKNPYRDLPPAG